MCDDEWMQFCNNEYSGESENISDKQDKRNCIPSCPKAQELYISTKSKIGYLDKEIDLANVYWKMGDFQVALKNQKESQRNVQSVVQKQCIPKVKLQCDVKIVCVLLD